MKIKLAESTQLSAVYRFYREICEALEGGRNFRTSAATWRCVNMRLPCDGRDCPIQNRILWLVKGAPGRRSFFMVSFQRVCDAKSMKNVQTGQARPIMR